MDFIGRDPGLKRHHRPELGEGRETVCGVVTAADWDEQGEITALVLSATDDREYLIENGAKFIGLLQESIAASGIVRRDRKAGRTINIKKFNLVSPAGADGTEAGWEH